MKFVAVLVLLVGAVICKPADEEYYDEVSYGDYREDKAQDESPMVISESEDGVLYPQNTSEDEVPSEVAPEDTLDEMMTSVNDTDEQMTTNEQAEDEVSMEDNNDEKTVTENALENELNSENNAEEVNESKSLFDDTTEEDMVTEVTSQDGLLMEDGELETTTAVSLNETEPQIEVKEFYGEDGLLTVIKEITHPDGTVENVASN